MRRHAGTKQDAPEPVAVSWPLAVRPGFLARRLHQIHVSLFAEICADFKITPLQYSVLSALAALGQADQTRLAAAVALDRTTTTGVLKRLQARGLIDRLLSAQDRRARDCRLTPAGHAMLTGIAPFVKAAHMETLAPLDGTDQAILIALIEKIVAAHAERCMTPALS